MPTTRSAIAIAAVSLLVGAGGTLGLAVGAGAVAASPPPAVARSTPESMMGSGSDMASTMSGDRVGMDAMHAAMTDKMFADMRPACDAAHAAMPDAAASNPSPAADPNHALHHGEPS